MPEYEAFDPFAGLPSPGQGPGESIGYILREPPPSVVAPVTAPTPAPVKQDIAPSQPKPTGYKNPEAGKILGYIYEKSGPAVPDTTIAGVPVVKKGSGDNTYYEAMPGTRPDLVQDGIGYAVANRGSDNETWIPISSAPEATKAEYSVNPTGGRAIPLYQPFFTPSWKGRPMTKEELFSSAAIMAGANDAPIQVSGLGKNIAQSHMFSEDVRKGLGLPQSFDMFKGVDPTKPDWGASNWRVYNPTSHGFFGDFFTSLAETGPLGTLAMTAAGIPPMLAGAISGGSSAYAADGNLLKGIATGALAGGAGQALNFALPGISSALSGVGGTALENAIDSGILGGTPVATGLSGIVQSVSSATGIPSEIITGAAKGAASSALSGGDPLQGALTGVVGSGTQTALAGMEDFKNLDPSLRNLISNAAKGATTALVTGRDPLESALSGGLSGALALTGKGQQPSPSQPAAPVDTDEEIRGTPIEYSTPTEDWIDRAGLAQQPKTLDQFLAELDARDAARPTSTEEWIDEGRLISKPLEIEIAGAPPPIEYATPTEEAIDAGGLGGAPYEYSTPTEDWIDRGGLGGAPGGAVGNMFGGISGGKGYSAPPATGPSATDKLVQQITGQQQQNSNISDLIAMLGIMGASKQQAAPPPIPLVGEIKPYQFSTDMLEGIYQQPKMARGGSINDLMRILRG